MPNKILTMVSLAAFVCFICFVAPIGHCKEAPLIFKSALKEKLAQKIILDFRYFCPDVSKEEAAQKYFRCVTPVTKLHKELAQLISDTSLGGVILFSENIETVEQTVTLTSDLQNAALNSAVGLPLFISTDQEGGRVVRIPRAIGTSFAGNMAIGATYAKHGDKYARKVGQILGNELNALGINVEHSPNVDVNINPENPVINVRSFSEKPQVVADLGIAMLEGIQSTGVIATLKHFPGHGDTSTDSHTGLPKVMHSLVKVNNVDLYPFKQIITNSNVKMIMTAHIQYPALDKSEVVNKLGKSMIKPATLSKKILTDLLRHDMNYQGLIITDALDMAGISRFFTPLEAVFASFDAGADIAMMPIEIRTQGDIERFKRFLEDLAIKVSMVKAVTIKEEPSMIDKINRSIGRVLTAKQFLSKQKIFNQQLAINIVKAESTLGNKQHRATELALAAHAIVEVSKSAQLSHIQGKFKNIQIIFPQPEQSDAFTGYLSANENNLPSHLYGNSYSKTVINQSSLEHYDESELFPMISTSDLVIVASDNKKSGVDIGGAEDLKGTTNIESTAMVLTKEKLNYNAKALKILTYAKKQGKTTIFVSLKLPSKLSPFIQQSDWVLATFDGNTYIDSVTNKNVSPSLFALSEVLLGNKKPTGVLPITL